MKIDRRVSMSKAALKVYYQRDIPLSEKIAAWNEIILTMPDCWTKVVVNEEGRCKYIDFTNFLVEYISLQQKLLEQIMDSAVSAYFFVMRGDFSQPKGPFDCFDVCREKALNKIKVNREYKGFIILQYSRPYKEMTADEIFDYGDEKIWCTLNRNGQITYIESDGGSDKEHRLTAVFTGIIEDEFNSTENPEEASPYSDLEEE